MWRMSRLTPDGTAEPVSRDQILRANGDRELFIFPVQLTTSTIDDFRLTYSVICDDHTFLGSSSVGAVLPDFLF